MNTYRYNDSVELDREHVVVADWAAYVEETEEFIRGIGFVDSITDETITFYVEADDLWDLREKVEEVKINLELRGMRLMHDSKDLIVHMTAEEVLNR